MLTSFALLLAAAVQPAPMQAGAGARQAALVAALVDLAEASYRAGRLDDALRVLDGGASLVTRREARPADLGRLQLQRAKSLYYRASLTGGAYEESIGALRGALAAAEAAGDQVLLSDAQDLLGLALYTRDFGRSEHAEARVLFEKALASRRGSGDRRGESESLFHLGLASENRSAPSTDDLRRARQRYEEALAAAVAGGCAIEASYAHRHLAGLLQEQRDLDGALRGFEASLILREASGYAIYVPPALLALGDVWKAKGDRVQARQHYSRALDEAERMGAERFRAAARQALAELDEAAPR